MRSSPRTPPGATDECDGVDNACNGSIDDGASETYYADDDGDGCGYGGGVCDENGENDGEFLALYIIILFFFQLFTLSS